jgi:hypothetical protein
MISCFCGAFCLVFVLRPLLVRENDKRDLLEERGPGIEDSEFMNLTDRENRGFRASVSILSILLEERRGINETE